MESPTPQYVERLYNYVDKMRGEEVKKVLSNFASEELNYMKALTLQLVDIRMHCIP